MSLTDPLIVNEQDTKEKEPVNKNVYVTLVLISFWGLADSIWGGAVLSAWLFLLAGGDPNPHSVNLALITTGIYVVRARIPHQRANTVVGGVEALQGIANLVTALPVGYLADKYGKAIMCKLGGVGCTIAAAITLTAIFGSWSTNEEIGILGFSLLLWGVFGGIFYGPLQALFADSIPRGQRSHYYTILQNCYLMPSIVGPLIAIGLFQKYGDNWTFSELRLPFAFGVLLDLPASMLSFFLSDVAIENEKEELDEIDQEAIRNKRESYVVPILGVTLTRGAIPYILFLADLVNALGSGMTIKFVPLFFATEIDLSPTFVQVLNMSVSGVLMVATFVAQRASKNVGRVQVVIFCRTCGIVLLLSLSQIVSHGIRSWKIVVPVYLLRAGFMNCAYPLDESILMDNVKQSDRSKWKALDSVAVVGWCGSAFIGGILADAFSYDFAFLITAIMQGLSCIIYSFLTPLVLDEKPQDKPKEEKTGMDDDDELVNSLQAASP